MTGGHLSESVSSAKDFQLKSFMIHVKIYQTHSYDAMLRAEEQLGSLMKSSIQTHKAETAFVLLQLPFSN